MSRLHYIIGVAIVGAIGVYAAKRRPAASSGEHLSAKGPDAQRVETTHVGGELAVRIKTFRTCDAGDLDLIDEDMSLLRDPDLLVSLEPLTPADGKAATVRRIKKRHLDRQSALTFPLPATKNPQHMALMICRDEAKTGKCSGKAVYATADLQQRYFFMRDRRKDQLKSQDKLFYFQYVVLQDGKLQFFTAHNDEQTMAREAKRLTALGGASPKVAAARLKRVVDTYEKLGSVVFQPERAGSSTRMNIMLEGFDQKACMPVLASGEKPKLRKFQASASVPAYLLPKPVRREGGVK